LIIGYLNSSSSTQGQPLQNLLTFLAIHPTLLPEKLHILSFRRSNISSILNLTLLESPTLKLLPRWELDFSTRRVPRRHNLTTLMDPKHRISEARELNNNLMRWRVAQGLNLDIIRSANIAILGMGTLGCGVVRTLMVSPTLSL
jgi:hypothetical protein